MVSVEIKDFTNPDVTKAEVPYNPNINENPSTLPFMLYKSMQIFWTEHLWYAFVLSYNVC